MYESQTQKPRAEFRALQNSTPKNIPKTPKYLGRVKRSKKGPYELL